MIFHMAGVEMADMKAKDFRSLGERGCVERVVDGDPGDTKRGGEDR